MSNQRKTTKANGSGKGWVIVHQPLRAEMVLRIDRTARSESSIQPVTRTQMIRVLIERGLAKEQGV